MPPEMQPMSPRKRKASQDIDHNDKWVTTPSGQDSVPPLLLPSPVPNKTSHGEFMLEDIFSRQMTLEEASPQGLQVSQYDTPHCHPTRQVQGNPGQNASESRLPTAPNAIEQLEDPFQQQLGSTPKVHTTREWAHLPSSRSSSRVLVPRRRGPYETPPVRRPTKDAPAPDGNLLSAQDSNRSGNLLGPLDPFTSASLTSIVRNNKPLPLTLPNSTHYGLPNSRLALSDEAGYSSAKQRSPSSPTSSELSPEQQKLVTAPIYGISKEAFEESMRQLASSPRAPWHPKQSRQYRGPNILQRRLQPLQQLSSQPERSRSPDHLRPLPQFLSQLEQSPLGPNVPQNQIQPQPQECLSSLNSQSQTPKSQSSSKPNIQQQPLQSSSPALPQNLQQKESQPSSTGLPQPHAQPQLPQPGSPLSIQNPQTQPTSPRVPQDHLPPQSPQPSSLFTQSPQEQRQSPASPNPRQHRSQQGLSQPSGSVLLAYPNSLQQRSRQFQNLSERQRLQPHPLSNSLEISPSPSASPPLLPTMPPTMPDSTALKLSEAAIDDLIAAGESPTDNEELRLRYKVSGILKSLQGAKSVKKSEDSTEPRRQAPTPSFAETALSRIKLTGSKPYNEGLEQENLDGRIPMFGCPADLEVEACSFCVWSCDWGISNEFFLHSAEATSDFCRTCQETNSFMEEFTLNTDYEGSNTSLVDSARFEELEKVSNQSPLSGSEGKEASPTSQARTKSKIDGRDTTQFQGVHFCKGSPYRQVDIAKVRICEQCRYKKFEIMRHRHKSFTLIALGKGEDTSLESKRCMVCVGLATYVCEGCPLRICGDCQTVLTILCKSYLDNLFYYYDRVHIRNDAFLLRSDGGGIPLEP